jgi:hypothetical protein
MPAELEERFVGEIGGIPNGPSSGESLHAQMIFFVDHDAERTFFVEEKSAARLIEREVVGCESTGDEVFALDGSDGSIDDEVEVGGGV